MATSTTGAQTRPTSWRTFRRVVARLLGAVVAVAGVSALAGAPGAGAARPQGAVGASALRPHTSVFGTDWPVYHGNALGTGVDPLGPSGTPLSPATPAWTSESFDGELYGEPLVEAGRVFVATENDTVYALAANTGHVLWSEHVSTAVPSGLLPCGNIGPTVGITSTPVIDPARSEIFVLADTYTDGTIDHVLYGLNIYSGTVELSEAADPPNSFHAYQLQRPGLALDDGEVVIGYGGNDGDCESGSDVYHGWVVAIPEVGGPMKTFEVDDTAPGQSQGAVWMGGGAPVVDASGNIWVSAGNGSVSSSSGPFDDSDSVLKLSAGLALEDYFAPSHWYDDNASDLDLGSSSPAIVGDGYVFEEGKSGTAYLLDQANLGHIGGQVLSEDGFCGNVVDGGESVSDDVVYAPCENGVIAVKIGTSPSSMTRLWQTGSGATGPAVVAGGSIWTMDTGGDLVALNPSTGVEEQSFNVGGEATDFPAPAVADGLLLAPAADDVAAFKGPDGLPPAPPPPPNPSGYWTATAGGAITAFGNAVDFGSPAGGPLNSPIVAMAGTADGGGYRLAGSDGGVFAYGDADFLGSMGGSHLNAPIVGIADDPTGDGYWLVASDGGIFAFGAAKFHGSMGGSHLNEPVVGITPTADGGGYWLVASDGGVFAFGDARFLGSMGGSHLNAPVVGMAAPAVGGGYWLVASDGGIFAFGAPFYGSMGATALASPIVAIASSPAGGYWLLGGDGGIFAFDAPFDGSAAGTPSVAMAGANLAAG